MRRAPILVLGGVLLAGCAAVLGLGDYGVGETETDGGTTSDVTNDTSSTPVDASVPDVDAPAKDASADAPVVKRPSFCTGITFYSRFDSTNDSSEGDKPIATGTSAVFDGRLGAALDLPTTATAFYPIGDAGTPRWLKSVGTMALWVRPHWDYASTNGHFFMRQAGVVPDDGVATELRGPLMAHSAGNVLFGFNTNFAHLASSGWREKGWNHLVGRWTHDPPTLNVVANGGALRDGGSAELTTTWDTPIEGNYVRLGSSDYGADCSIDDVVLWTRRLDDAEIRSIYDAATSGKAIGDACGLP